MISRLCAVSVLCCLCLVPCFGSSEDVDAVVEDILTRRVRRVSSDKQLPPLQSAVKGCVAGRRCSSKDNCGGGSCVSGIAVFSSSIKCKNNSSKCLWIFCGCEERRGAALSKAARSFCGLRCSQGFFSCLGVPCASRCFC